MRLGRKEEAENILAFITKDMKFEASREAYFSTLRMFKGWVSPEDTEAQCNMPDCKDKFTRLYAISNYYYITGDLENSNRVIDRILEEAGNKADSMIASAKETIRIEREKTIHELKGEITGLAIASAAKIAGGKSDEERESQLFDQFLRETGEGHGNENK